MSNTELQRALKQIRTRKERILHFLQIYLFPLFKLRVLKGTIVHHQSGEPLSGVVVRLNQKRSIKTNTEGQFAFHFLVSTEYSLSLQWNHTELIDWIHVYAQQGRTTYLKLKWPHIVRGQIFGPTGLPLRDINVCLNDQYQTQTDVHGSFSFPRNEGEEVRFERFSFKIGAELFIHHFNLDLAQNPLYRFFYDGHSLFHVDQKPQAIPNSKYVAHLASRFKWWKRCALGGCILILLSFFFHQPFPSISSNIQHQLGTHLISIKPESTSSLQEPERSLQDNYDPELSDSFGIDLSKSTCNHIEFSYSFYYVPRGMEGFLLSHLFGQWQTWSALSKDNHMEKRNLQAGQKIRLKLPLHSWKLFKVRPRESVNDVLKWFQCPQESYGVCKQLIQVWNSHIKVQHLRKTEVLLINPSLMKNPVFGEETLKRLEKIKRFRLPRKLRRREPVIRVPKGCKAIGFTRPKDV